MRINIRYILLLCISAACLFSCSGDKTTDRSAVTIRLTGDSSSIIVKGLDYAVTESLETDSINAQEWQSLLFVCKEAADEDLKGVENAVPGKYSILKGNLLFKPDSAFSKGSTYRAELRIPEFSSQRDLSLKKNLPGRAEVQLGTFRF